MLLKSGHQLKKYLRKYMPEISMILRIKLTFRFSILKPQKQRPMYAQKYYPENAKKAFKCHDCIFQNNSIMCVQCFQGSQHKGHIYEVVQVFGGCCDCGDEQKWDPAGFCKKHSDKNLVQEMQQKVDKKQQGRFIQQLGFCYLYYFILYDQALKRGSLQPEIAVKKQQKASNFGLGLIEYLSEFNKDSLISNIMTFNLFKSKFLLKEFQLIFCKDAENKTILEIMFHVIKLRKCAQMAVNLFTQLFPLREFRKQLTITFMHLHQQSTEFAMSDYNHLTCQLLTSHKMIRELVEKKQIPPLTYKPAPIQHASFSSMRNGFMRYFIDIDYLTNLYKDTAQKYMCYHILQGQITSIGYYKVLSYLYEDAINYYGVEQLSISKMFGIMNAIKNSQQCITVLQKGMKDLWLQCRRLYKLWNSSLFNSLLKQQTYESESLKNIYITYQLHFSLLAFTYFQKLTEKQPSTTQQQKLQQLINVLLDIKSEQKSLQEEVLQMLQIVNNNLILLGLALGHQQTMERYYTFYAFNFKKTHIIISCIFFLYKILTKMLLVVRKQSKLSQTVQICDQFIFKRPFNQIENLFVMGQFKDDNQSIFDRKKSLIKITYFLHLLIQASQTDFYQLIIACYLGFLQKDKYQKMLNKFYIDILKIYNKSSIKDFKKITDSFIPDDQAFQKFIASSKQIIIEHGKISLKSMKQEQEKQSKSKEQKVKVESELNLFYYKSFRNNLINLSDKQIVFKIPQSSNHFLHEILSQEFVHNLMKLLSSYIDMMVMVNQKIKSEQSGTLGYLVIQMIKIGKAFEKKPGSKIPDMVFSYFRNLQNKKDHLSIFSQQIVKVICSQSHQNNTKIHQTMSSLDKQAQRKAQQRKRKLLQKKKKMVAKFKQNQQKFEQTYGNELRKIRDEMQEQNEMQVQQQKTEQSKCCIICRQGEQKSRFMLMCFMQLTDLYEHMIKGKQKDSPNSHVVFKTCGHFIHQQCYKKTHKSQLQQYSMCQLCKVTVNCLFPICVKDVSTQKQQKQKQQKNMSKEANLIEKQIRDNEKEYERFLQQQKQNQRLYEQLKITFSQLYAINFRLMEDCENGFSQPLIDDNQIKLKLLQSLVSQIIFSAIISKQQSQNNFNKNQLTIYRNILYALKIFDQGDIKQSHELIKLNKQKTLQQEITTIISMKRLSMKRKRINQLNQQKKNVLYLNHQMEIYLLIWIGKFLTKKQSMKFSLNDVSKLSQETISIIDSVMKQLLLEKDYQRILMEDKKIHNEKQISQSKQLNIFNKQIQFFNPPSTLSQLIKLRGKCPNCQKFTNMIHICLICQWKGCKNCHIQSVNTHTRNQHCGNSIYLDADVGNIYLVCKKKYWVYASIYQDYLGESFKAYQHGVKLQKYTLNELKYDKLKKILMSYGVESTIRYEEYSKKRVFLGTV